MCKINDEISCTIKNQDYTYKIVDYHRNGLPPPSKWIVIPKDELNCFINSINNDWIINDRAWGIILNENKCKVIGLNEKSEEVKIATFKTHKNSNFWHGYPYNIAKLQDRPHTNVLINWRDNGFIKKTEMSRISRGIKCNL
ncbi:MAG: hypothetical protein IAE65_05280 [Ignavibacteria bacterium]|nr:hypothetical protein [Ignavibacteria bacterium]